MRKLRRPGRESLAQRSKIVVFWLVLTIIRFVNVTPKPLIRSSAEFPASIPIGAQGDRERVQVSQIAAQTLKINHDRLYADFEELAQIGTTPEGGVNRLARSSEERRSRASFGRGNSCGDGSMTRRSTVRAPGSMVQRSKGTRLPSFLMTLSAISSTRS